MKKMKRKNILKAVVAIAICLAFVLPGDVIANDEEIYPNSLNVVVEENVISFEEYRDPKYLGRADGDIILDEDFESEWVPFRWNVIQNTDETNYDHPCWWSQLEGRGSDGSLGAGVWWGREPQDEWLMTPALDLSVWTEASLSFWTYNYGFREGCWEGDFVKVSPDGGETWETLGNLYEMAPPYPGGFFRVTIDFDLSDYAGLTEVVVAFHRLTGDVNMNLGVWFIDDIVINGYGRSTVDVQEVSGGLGINAVIGNDGNGEATDVEWSITVEGGLILFGGSNNGKISSLLPGEAVAITSGLLFGLAMAEINVTVDDMWMVTDGLVLGPFVIAKAKNYVPADSTTINWVQCTITVDISMTYPDLRGQHSVQFVDKDGNILGSKSGITFTDGVATFSVENWIKNKLNAGGWVNVRV